MYVNSHFTITTVTLAFIYLRRNASFYFIRNMFMVAMGIALVLYAAYPTAPPRFMPEWGFSDSVAHFTGLTAEGSSADALYNPFAAVPSMHVAFALMLGVPMASMARRRWVKALWLVLPGARHASSSWRPRTTGGSTPSPARSPPPSRRSRRCCSRAGARPPGPGRRPLRAAAAQQAV